MSSPFLTKTFAAGLGLLVLSAAAPVALADAPGYLFQDFASLPQANVQADAAHMPGPGAGHDSASASMPPSATRS